MTKFILGNHKCMASHYIIAHYEYGELTMTDFRLNSIGMGSNELTTHIAARGELRWYSELPAPSLQIDTWNIIDYLSWSRPGDYNFMNSRAGGTIMET